VFIPRILTLAVLLTLFIAAQVFAVSPEREQEFRTTIVPLLKTYCIDCHNADENEGKFDITSYRSAQEVLVGRKKWLTAVGKLQAKSMPPEEGRDLPESQRKILVDWITATVNDIDCSGSPNPGHVTIRRLNRIEYRNTIRDLTGVDYKPADDFPGDDVGYGFDNIGDVLSLPPLLMEKYLTAAQDIADKTMQLEAGPAKTIRKPAEEMRSTAGGSARSGERILTTSGEMYFDFEFPHDGEYEFHALAYGDQAGDEVCKMSFRIDGERLKTVDVPADESKPEVYEAKFEVKAGRRKVALAFENDYYNPRARDRNQRDRNLWVRHLEIIGPTNAPPEFRDRRPIIFVRPSERVSQRKAYEQVLARFASRAYRRPATTKEVGRLVALAESAADSRNSFEAGIHLAMQAVIASPHFLFRIEKPGKPGENRMLTEYELAASLSYFLWSSMPDDELLLLAFNGKLREGDTLRRQVKRMLASPKSNALVNNFGSQWLQLRDLSQMTPDTDEFAFDESLRSAMIQETELFFAEIIREDRNVLTFLDADFTYLNERLAKHYGIQDVRGSEFRRVSLHDTLRGGLLTHASVLTVTSNPTRTSPVKRGKWILDNLLNDPPPPPAPDVPQLDEQDELTGTLRERMEQHRSDPGCASCHQRMDPLGFALENFDAVGAYRTTDEGHKIDATGVLPTGESFDGVIALRQVLAKRKGDAFVRCLSEKLLTYGLGRGVEYYDKCAVDEIVKHATANDLSFSSLIIGIVESEPFQNRRTPEVQ